MLGPWYLLKLFPVIALTRMSIHYLYRRHHFYGKNHPSKGPEHLWLLVGILVFPSITHIFAARGFKENNGVTGVSYTVKKAFLF
jgi:hypothetical protein